MFESVFFLVDEALANTYIESLSEMISVWDPISQHKDTLGDLLLQKLENNKLKVRYI